MTKTLLDGPGRVLESIHSRFLVDLAQGDDARHPQAHQQQFRERLMQELLARVQLQAWTNGGMLNAPLSLRSHSKLPPCMSGFQPVVAGRKRR